MTPQLHTELAALIDCFYRDDITEEGWALLQIHMAYCTPCEEEFLKRKRLSEAARVESGQSSKS